MQVTEEIIDELYSLFGANDLLESDKDFAIELALEKYPALTDDQILDIFQDFLNDNPA